MVGMYNSVLFVRVVKERASVCASEMKEKLSKAIIRTKVGFPAYMLGIMN